MSYDNGRDGSRTRDLRSASLSLESKLRDLGWTVKRSPFAQVTEPSGRIGVTLERGAAQVEGSGGSFEEALARAALEAVA